MSGYANKQYNNQFPAVDAKLRRQKRQDYILDPTSARSKKIDSGIDGSSPSGKHQKGDLNILAHKPVQIEQNTEVLNEPNFDEDYEYPRDIKDYLPDSAYATKIPKFEVDIGDESSERVNYDQAFEEVKFIVNKSPHDSHNLYDQFLDNDIDTPSLNSQSEEYQKHSDDNLDFVDNDLSDFKDEMADEYATNEAISLPKHTFSARKEVLGSKEDNYSEANYKFMSHQGNSTNTLAKAVTHHKSAESSESLLRSPNLVIGNSSNLKTYVLSKSRKMISSLNRSEKD